MTKKGMVEQLVKRIKNKEQEAMSQLYSHYIGLLTSVCYRYVPTEDEAKDVLQNSFIKIFSSIPSIEYRSEAAFKAWIIRVVVNESLLFLKERKKMRYADSDVTVLHQIPDDDDPDTEQLSPDELHQLISELPDGYRTVVNLYVFEGYSHKEIAKLLNIKESTSASQLYYAKRLLTKKIRILLNRKK